MPGSGRSSHPGATHTAMATSRANNAPIVQYVKHGGITNQLFKQVFADAASF